LPRCGRGIGPLLQPNAIESEAALKHDSAHAAILAALRARRRDGRTRG
jgi:hypothetical protein